ncbi:MAG: copper resistance protein CopC [Beggiatoa sp.]|nr:copper resistance protein CopC [Beggiatoa sp.]
MSPATVVRARLRWVYFIGGVFALILPPVVCAHAIVVESMPVHDARLETSPPRILLRFNTKIEHGLCRVRLEGPDGDIEMPLDPPEAPERLEARMPPLVPGTYLLRYRTFSPDGHVTEGVLRFHVGNHYKRDLGPARP